jgi:hypothetical protein
MTTQQYIDNLNKRFQTGISREHAYRGDLQTLLEKMLPEILVTNEPARIACGAPDYILTKKYIFGCFIKANYNGIELKRYLAFMKYIFMIYFQLKYLRKIQ